MKWFKAAYGQMREVEVVSYTEKTELDLEKATANVLEFYAKLEGHEP